MMPWKICSKNIKLAVFYLTSEPISLATVKTGMY